MRMRHLGQTAAALLLFLLFACTASAETAVDILYGAADSGDTDIAAHYQLLTVFGPGSRETATRRVAFDTSDALAVRLRHYTEEAPWLGLALEAGYYQADGDGADIDLVPFSAMLLVRLATYGGPYPYCGLGLSWAAADVDVDFRPQLSSTVSGTATGLGPDLRAGFAWPVSPMWGIFFEYRYLRLDMEMDDADDFALYSEEIEEAEFDMETQFVMGGLSMHF